eukprot:147784_1
MSEQLSMNAKSVNFDQERISITCPDASSDVYHFRSSQVTKSNIMKVFGIPSKLNFFLIDKDNNIELEEKDGSYNVTAKTLYIIQFTKANWMIKDTINNTSDLKLDDDKEDIDEIDWSQCSLMDLSKGTGGKTGEKVYTAANGVTVTSSAPVWNNSNYYYMSYLFNGILNCRGDKSDARTSYWMTSSSGDQNLIIDFGKSINLSFINIAAATYEDNGKANKGSDYSIDVFEKRSNKWMNICGIIDTSNDALEYVRRHDIKHCVAKIRINLTQRIKKYGVCLKEIDCYVVDD